MDVDNYSNAHGEWLAVMSAPRVGKHRGEAAGPWMAYEPKHRAPGGEMAAVGFTLVPLVDGSE